MESKIQRFAEYLVPVVLLTILNDPDTEKKPLLSISQKLWMWVNDLYHNAQKLNDEEFLKLHTLLQTKLVRQSHIHTPRLLSSNHIFSRHKKDTKVLR